MLIKVDDTLINMDNVVAVYKWDKDETPKLKFCFNFIGGDSIPITTTVNFTDVEYRDEAFEDIFDCHPQDCYLTIGETSND